MISGDPWSKHKRGWKRWKSGSIHESWWIMVNDYESSQACSASQRVRFYANPSTQPGSPGSMIQRPTARSYQRRAWSGGSGSGPQTNWHPIQLVIWNLQSNMWLQATWVCSFWIYIYIYLCIYTDSRYICSWMGSWNGVWKRFFVKPQVTQSHTNWTLCIEDTLNQANPRQVASAQGLLGFSIPIKNMPRVISSVSLHQILLTTDGNPANGFEDSL